MKLLLFLLSWAIVAWGQETGHLISSVLAGSVGFAIICYVLLRLSNKQRFLVGTLWFTAVQCMQLWWLISHPYSYIWIVWGLLASAMGAQFGLWSLFLTRRALGSVWGVLALAGGWTLLEWSRLFLLSGLTWNPTGLALGASTYSLQMASLVGVYGLSFWVILTNLWVLRTWELSRGAVIAAALILFPYLYGIGQIALWDRPASTMDVALVQTAFPAEEMIEFASGEESVAFVTGEWQKILSLLRQHRGKKLGFIAMPEGTVPYGTYYPLYPYEVVKSSFETLLGSDVLEKLPPPNHHYAKTIEGIERVNNAFWAQAIANVFDTPVVLGLEDQDFQKMGLRDYYAAAFVFYPRGESVGRYEKRILLPMGEYIPFSFCRDLAARYGVGGSFTPGKEAKVYDLCGVACGLSVCYEETFGHLMRENKQKGAQLLINVTNDEWYPHSSLPRSHFAHARFRTVEMGIPLARACNSGVTGGIDAFGRTVKILENEEGDVEDVADALFVKIPLQSYPTLYSFSGDNPLLIWSTLVVGIYLVRSRRQIG